MSYLHLRETKKGELIISGSFRIIILNHREKSNDKIKKLWEDLFILGPQESWPIFVKERDKLLEKQKD